MAALGWPSAPSESADGGDTSSLRPPTSSAARLRAASTARGDLSISGIAALPVPDSAAFASLLPARSGSVASSPLSACSLAGSIASPAASSSALSPQLAKRATGTRETSRRRFINRPLLGNESPLGRKRPASPVCSCRCTIAGQAPREWLKGAARLPRGRSDDAHTARWGPRYPVVGGHDRKLFDQPQRVLERSIVRPSSAPAAPPRIAPRVRSPPLPATSWPSSAPTPAPTSRPVVPLSRLQ